MLERGDEVKAQLRLPDGRTFNATLRADLETLAGDELAGKFLNKLKKAGKKTLKVVKAVHLKPLQLAHKITHKGPLGKLEKKAQELVGKALPFTKPFIKIHNSIAAPVHKAIETGKVKKKVTAAAIKQVTKDIPDLAQRKGVQAALAVQMSNTELLKGVAKKAVKAKVVKAATAALKKNPANKVAKKVVAKAKAAVPKGTYKVTLPNGRTVNVPAAKVAS